MNNGNQRSKEEKREYYINNINSFNNPYNVHHSHGRRPYPTESRKQIATLKPEDRKLRLGKKPRLIYAKIIHHFNN